jgi:hypothetical protein
LIWTSCKSASHQTNDRVMVHGYGTRADGRRSRSGARIGEMLGPRVGVARRSLRIKKSNVVPVQAGYLARPTTKAPETQIYFITHGSGAFLVLRLRTVVRGERASRSIVNRTAALWSIWVVASLILADLDLVLIFTRTRGREVAESRGSNGSPNIRRPVPIRPKWTLTPTNGRKRT